MIPLPIADIVEIVGGRLEVAGAESMVVDGSVQTDSRLVTDGSIFFALPGEVTDGQLFIGTGCRQLRNDCVRQPAADAILTGNATVDLEDGHGSILGIDLLPRQVK